MKIRAAAALMVPFLWACHGLGRKESPKGGSVPPRQRAAQASQARPGEPAREPSRPRAGASGQAQPGPRPGEARPSQPGPRPEGARPSRPASGQQELPESILAKFPDAVAAFAARPGGPRVIFLRPAVQGYLKRSAVVAATRRDLKEILGCYTRYGLRKHKGLEGLVKVQFVVNNKGKVTSNAVSSDGLHNRDVSSCLRARVRSWTFPPYTGGSISVVRVAFHFQPKSPKEETAPGRAAEPR